MSRSTSVTCPSCRSRLGGQPGDDIAQENKAAWAVLSRFDKPFVTAFSDADPITAGGEKAVQERVPGAERQPHVMLSGAHFLQEDCPEDIVAVIANVLASSQR